MGNVSASEDAKRYRDGYPGKEDDPRIKTNLEFYQNKRASKPEGDTIENIHKKWFGKYGLLEAHHGYIQWLFPIREDGMNHYADQLQLHEAKAISSDPVLQGRIITSYELMLDFYGIKLADRKTERNSNWKERYQHLNRSFHNYLRITRILKCLGEMGLEHFKLPFVKFMLTEVYENRELQNCRESLVKYWAPVLRREADLKEAYQIVEKYEGVSQGNSNSNRGRVSHYSDSESDQDSQESSVKPAAADVKNNSNTETSKDNNSNTTEISNSPSETNPEKEKINSENETNRKEEDVTKEETPKEDAPKPKEDSPKEDL